MWSWRLIDLASDLKEVKDLTSKAIVPDRKPAQNFHDDLRRVGLNRSINHFSLK